MTVEAELEARRDGPTPRRDRTVDVRIPDGPFAGWEATVRIHFPARELAALQSGDLSRMIAAFDRIVVRHNLVDDDGQPARSVGDVDYAGLFVLLKAAMDAIGSLPKG